MLTFHTINQSHIVELHNHYLKFEPYSDFNTLSLWGYMVPGAKYSKLGDAIVYQFKDYNNNATYLSILGKKDSIELASRLVAQYGGSLELYCVPETTLKHLKGWVGLKYFEEDIDNHDYIFEVDRLARLLEVGKKDKRKLLRKFMNNFPDVVVEKLDHTTSAGQKAIASMFMEWVEQSESKSWTNEFDALRRELRTKSFSVVVLGAYYKNRLIGFTVNEVEKNYYCQGHFGKADYNFPSLGLFLEVETAKYMQTHFESKYINLQQDMGIEGIRYYKQSLEPIRKLKKYNIKLELST